MEKKTEHKEDLLIKEDITTNNNQPSSNTEPSSNNQDADIVLYKKEVFVPRVTSLIDQNEYTKVGSLLKPLLDLKEYAVQTVIYALYDHDDIKLKKSKLIDITQLLGLEKDSISQHEFERIKMGYNVISRVKDPKLKEICRNLNLSILKELSPISKYRNFETHLNDIISELRDDISCSKVKEKVRQIKPSTTSTRKPTSKEESKDEDGKEIIDDQKEETTSSNENTLLGIPPTVVSKTITVLIFSYNNAIRNKNESLQNNIKETLNKLKEYIEDENLIYEIDNIGETPIYRFNDDKIIDEIDKNYTPMPIDNIIDISKEDTNSLFEMPEDFQ